MSAIRLCPVESGCVEWSRAVLSGVGPCLVEFSCVELTWAVLNGFRLF